jgi:putative hemolysin
MIPMNKTLQHLLSMGLLVLLVLVLFVSPVAALKSPAAVYCKAMGYQNSGEKDASSNEVELCILPDGKAVDAWHFLRGTAAQQYSYCAKQGYEQKTVASRAICAQFLTDTCAVCVKKDGTEVEVTKVMGLNFDETTCGDGTCGFPESYVTCPKDCPSAGRDEACQPALDGRCDPDCGGTHGDPDCLYLSNPLLTILAVLVILVIAAIIIWYILKKKKQTPQ